MANTAIRWSGLLLIVGAVLLGTAIVLATSNRVPNQGFSLLVSNLFLLAALSLLLSLPGMYAKQASAAGWLGLVGFTLSQAGVVLFAMLATPGLWYPSIKQPFPESVSGGLLAIALMLGLLLTGIATLRARVFPRWASILLFGATALFFFSFFIAELLPPLGGLPGVLLGLLLAFPLTWFGVAMLQRTRVQS